MRSKPSIIITGILAALLLLVVACSGGFFLGRVSTPTPGQALLPSLVSATRMFITGDTQTPGVPATQQEITQQVGTQQVGTPADLGQLFKPFWEAWDFVHAKYVDQPVDDVKLMRGAIKGMLESLGDEHTSYMDPDQFRQMNLPLQQEYDGIGAWVDTTAEYLTIIGAMKNSPAEKAGLKSGDEIIAVDGEDMTGIDGNLVIRKVVGPAGSKVTLTIRRKTDGDPLVFDVEVTREKINIPSVEGKMLDNKVAYVQIYRFAEDTKDELRKNLKDLLAQDPVGLVIDLRNDPGGYLETAIQVTSEFIGDGVIMYEETGDGQRKTYEAMRGGLGTKIPLVVLINEGSASSAEIMAGAIQDRGRGKLVGVTSYGKGSVQQVTTLSDDQGAIRVTVAHWLTPNGRLIHKVGIDPDVVVPMTEEDFKAGRDPQLDKAIELLLSGGS